MAARGSESARFGPETFPELFIALVGAAGTDLGHVEQLLMQELSRVRYEAESIRLSVLMSEVPGYRTLSSVRNGPEDARIDKHMTAGDEIRRTAKRGDAVLLLGLSKITKSRRPQSEENPVRVRHAYIFNSLKHPDEVRSLRKIYGDLVLVVAVYSPRSQRIQRLCERIAKSRKQYKSDKFLKIAGALVDRDEHEAGDEFGQNLRDTFPLADVFLDAENGVSLRGQISRFVSIVFGHPYVTPTVDEYIMFHARAAALRSADLSRQVGAVIATPSGDIISAGCNEVPKAGGGQFWESDRGTRKDYRDFSIGHDASARMKFEIVSDTLEKLRLAKWIRPRISDRTEPNSLVEKALLGSNAPLRDARVTSIIEFGRIVHAEMAALTDSSRRGLSVLGATIYCTTFPCHMCARHIISSGLGRVVYIEPYPKSMAKDLYGKSIRVDHDLEADEDAVSFEPFMGISPRKYFSFFEMKGPRKDQRGYAIRWDTRKAAPILTGSTTYLERELAAVVEIEQMVTRTESAHRRR